MLILVSVVLGAPLAIAFTAFLVNLAWRLIMIVHRAIGITIATCSLLLFYVFLCVLERFTQ